MIGKKHFFATERTTGINPKHAARLEECLQALHTAISIEDMDIPGWKQYILMGDHADKNK